MKIVTCRSKADQRQFLAVSRDGSAFVDLTGLSDDAGGFPNDMLSFLAQSDAMSTRAAKALDAALAAGVKLWSVDELSFLPAVPRPGKILHTSVNFSAHKKEVASKFKSEE